MALIVKKGPGLKGMNRKQAYVWGACLLAFIFVLFALFFVTGGNKNDVKPDDFTGVKPQAFDLAQLPFANDAAEQALMNKYTDLNGNLPESTLYSPEEKAARQEADAADAFSGIPASPAPDAEYADAQKDIPANSPASDSYGMNAALASVGLGGGHKTTEVGQLQKGDMAGTNVGGNFSSGNIYDPSNVFSGGGYDNHRRMPLDKQALSQIANTREGRVMLGLNAGVNEAAGKKGAAAQQALVKAWAGAGNPSNMDGGMEKALAQLDGNKGGLAVNAPAGGPSASDIANAVKNAQPGNKPEQQKECQNFSFKCLLQDAAKNLVNSLASNVASAATSWMMPSSGSTIGDQFRSCKGDKDCLDYLKSHDITITNNTKKNS